MFGFLAAALVLQALPVGIVTYTELYANGGLEGVASTFSYFHFPRAAHYCCAPFLSAAAVPMELALFIGSILGGVGRTGSAQMICLCVASVSAAAAFFMCETLASGVVAGLLILATVVHGWKTGTLGGDIYHLAHMEIPAHPFGRAGILTEDHLNAEAQRNSQR